MRMLLKLDRLAAWVLFVGLFLYFVTGLSMTKGILTPALAYKLHLSYLTYFVLVAFVVHTGFAIHLAFKRWRIWNPVTKIILVLFYISFVSFFFYIDKIYQLQRVQVKTVDSISDQAVSPSAPVNTGNSQVNSKVVSTATNEKVFSAVELAKFNGLNGQPAYAAVDGVVYDLSAVFVGGQHFGYSAGQDLTDAFYSKHRKSLLVKYQIVGNLK